VLSHDLILIPIHKTAHWALAIMNVPQKVFSSRQSCVCSPPQTLSYLDSLGNHYPTCMRLSRYSALFCSPAKGAQKVL
jgi:Ulp1 family protease